jgi:hypothetical protein
MGGKPNGRSYVRPSSVVFWWRDRVLTSTRGRNSNSEKALRFAFMEALVSTPPEIYPNTGRGRNRRAGASKSSRQSTFFRRPDAAFGTMAEP